jgi:hypothetical protein
MILLADRKKQLNQILGSENGEALEAGPLDKIAEELIEAVHNSDVQSVISCLKLFLAKSREE